MTTTRPPDPQRGSSWWRRLAGFLAISALVGPSIGAEAPVANLPPSRLAGIDRWWCYYGADARAFTSKLPLLILEGDHFAENRALPAKTVPGQLRLAYVSLGQINIHHWAFPAAAQAHWLRKVDPSWPEARGVDVRAPDWRTLVVEAIAPLPIQRGFDGLFLDTIDNALAAEDASPGTHDALVGLIAALRQRLPNAVLLANGGALVAPRLAPLVDGFLIEDIESSWDFAKKTHRSLQGADKAGRLALLNSLKATGRPVFVLDYAAAAEREAVTKRLRQRGVSAMVGGVALDELPPDVSH
jgi:uncharacterized protein (TIGR01370 family)